MSEEIAQRFVEALHTLERSRNVEPIVALFNERSQIGNVAAPESFHGQEGARRFWSEYRGVFGNVESVFRNIIAADGRAALEWTTTGTSFDGAPLKYEGVSILEMEGEYITRFHAYFDPSRLGRQLIK